MVSEMNQFAVVLGGPGLQALEAGFRFLSQSLKAGCGSAVGWTEEGGIESSPQDAVT